MLFKKQKYRRAVLVDIQKESLTEFKLGDSRQISKIIGATTITPLRLDERHYMFVDELGLLNIHKNTKWMKYCNYSTPIVSNGLIIANNAQGEIVDVTLSIPELLTQFTFGSDGVKVHTL
tara:strand:+ start:176 stop:535 length:360 start_codon:yes stop_codon:yes gene_type:complete